MCCGSSRPPRCSCGHCLCDRIPHSGPFCPSMLFLKMTIKLTGNTHIVRDGSVTVVPGSFRTIGSYFCGWSIIFAQLPVSPRRSCHLQHMSSTIPVLETTWWRYFLGVACSKLLWRVGMDVFARIAKFHSSLFPISYDTLVHLMEGPDKN